MTNTNSHTPSSCAVVVGVDGTAASVNAARYALEEAGRAGRGVDVIHVVPTHVPTAPMYPLPLEDLMEAGRFVLRSVMDQLQPMPDGVPVRALVRSGGIVATLTAERSAHALVVGSDRRPVAARLLTGNVSTGVAASAAAPVVSVPETWRSGRPTGVVLVGVKHRQHSDELLAEAFAVAQERGSRLLVMHAWKMPSGYDDIIAARVAIEVEVRTSHDQAAHALVTASAEADEVVLVRRAHGIPAAVHLGATARSVLMHSRCPVRIVPPGREREALDLDLESAGALLK